MSLTPFDYFSLLANIYIAASLSKTSPGFLLGLGVISWLVSIAFKIWG